MFGVGVGIRVGGRTAVSGGYDPDAQAFFDRVATAGGTLTTTEKNATNQLVLDMKSAGIWTAMKAVYPMVGASAAACAQNLKSSSFTGTFTSGWTFSANGVQGNGTSAYMDTNLISNSVLSISSAAMGFSTNIANTIASGVEFGSQYSTEGMSIWSNAFSSSMSRIGRGADATTIPYTTAGRIHGSRQTSSLQTLYRNSSAVATGSGAITVLDSVNTLTLGGLNLASGVSLWSDARFDFAYVSDGLSSTNISNLDSAIVTFNSTLSR